MSKRFSLVAIILLLIWISFFPLPLQEKYNLAVMGSLVLIFIFLFIKKRASMFKPSDLPLWFFLAAIGLNVLFSQQKGVAFRTYLDLAIPLFLIYYLVPEGMFTKDKLNLLARVICILSILVALGGVMDILLRINFIYEHFMPNPFYQRYKTDYFMRATSTQFHASVLGSYLIASLPFNFLLIKQTNSLSRLLGIVGTIIIFPVIILTFSRGVFLGLVAMLLFILYTAKDRRLVAIFFIILSIFLILSSYLPYPFSKLGLNGFFRYGDSIFSSDRLQRYIMAGRIIKEHPFAGLGFQHFRIQFYEYFSGRETVPYEFMIADNMYLTMLAETGVIGFTGFFVFILSIFIKGGKQLIKLKHLPQDRQRLIFILSSFVGLSVNAMAYELFYWPGQYMYFCILIGLIEAFYRDKRIYES